jgi:aryl-alcohol dehydrogenase
LRISAAVVREQGGSFIVEDVELDAPRSDEILIEFAATGICHTDLSVRDGLIPVPLPAVLGHEGAGVVRDIGSAVTEFEVGDHVVVSVPHCGHCRYCASGEPTYCVDAPRLSMSGGRGDGSPTITSVDGDRISASFMGQSSMATHSIVVAHNAIRVPKDLPLARLAPLGCGVLTGAGTVINELRPQPGQSLAVFGCGGVGLSAVMAAVALDQNVVAIDTNPKRLALAAELGATATVCVGDGDVAAAVGEIVPGGVDASIEATGLPPVAETAVGVLSSRGRCALVGAAAFGAKFSVDWWTLATGRSVTGVIMGSSVPRQTIAQLIDWHRDGRFPFDRLCTEYPFADIQVAVSDMEAGDVIKPLLVH